MADIFPVRITQNYNDQLTPDTSVQFYDNGLSFLRYAHHA